MEAVLKCRKGIFALLVMGFMYYLLIGTLPADTPADLVVKMYEIFGTIVAVVSATYIGATAYENSFSDESEHAPVAEVVEESKRAAFDAASNPSHN